MLRRPLHLLALIAILALLVPACGGEADPVQDTEAPADLSKLPISSGDGTVGLMIDEGSIPAGGIQINKYLKPQISGFKVLAATEFKPHDLLLAKPANLVFALGEVDLTGVDPEKLFIASFVSNVKAAAIKGSAADTIPNGIGEQIASSYDKARSRVSGDISHLGIYGLVVQDLSQDGSVENIAPPKANEDSTDELPLVEDLCPNNPYKLAPGACGCDRLDIDSDLDETHNCQDECPLDPAKTVAGLCGCGVIEDNMDSDGDGVLDCNDNCPEVSNAAQIDGDCGSPLVDFAGVLDGAFGAKAGQSPFGWNGYRHYNLDNNVPADLMAGSSTLDNEGRLLVAGCVATVGQSDQVSMAVWRFNQDGSPDMSFANEGIYVFREKYPIGGSCAHGITTAVIEGLERIIVAGDRTINTLSIDYDRNGILDAWDEYTSDTDMAVWMLNPNGKLRTEFGPGGMVTFKRADGRYESGAAVSTTLVNGVPQIIVVGSSEGDAGRDLTVWSIKSYGARETAWNNQAGYVVGDKPPEEIRANGQVIGRTDEYGQGLAIVIFDGHPYILASGMRVRNGKTSMIVRRFKIDGTVDRDFGDLNGVLLSPEQLACTNAGSRVAILQNGLCKCVDNGKIWNGSSCEDKPAPAPDLRIMNISFHDTDEYYEDQMHNRHQLYENPVYAVTIENIGDQITSNGYTVNAGSNTYTFAEEIVAGSYAVKLIPNDLGIEPDGAIMFTLATAGDRNDLNNSKSFSPVDPPDLLIDMITYDAVADEYVFLIINIGSTITTDGFSLSDGTDSVMFDLPDGVLPGSSVIRRMSSSKQGLITFTVSAVDDSDPTNNSKSYYQPPTKIGAIIREVGDNYFQASFSVAVHQYSGMHKILVAGNTRKYAGLALWDFTWEGNSQFGARLADGTLVEPIAIDPWGQGSSYKLNTDEINGTPVVYVTGAGRSRDGRQQGVQMRRYYAMGGGLDMSFGDQGKAMVVKNGIVMVSDPVSVVFETSTKSFIISGRYGVNMDSVGQSLAIARLSAANGSLSNSISDGGLSFLGNQARAGGDDVALGTVADGDGRSIVVGVTRPAALDRFLVMSEGPSLEMFMARLTVAGDIDQSFSGGKGVFISATKENERAAGVARDEARNIYTVGSSMADGAQPALIIRKFLPTGIPDLQFGAEGRLVYRGAEVGGQVVVGSAIMVVKNGGHDSLFVAGTAGELNRTTAFLCRFTTGGIFEGCLKPPMPSEVVGGSVGVSFAKQMIGAGERILMVINGDRDPSAEVNNSTVIVSRFNTDGTLDSNFGLAVAGQSGKSGYVISDGAQRSRDDQAASIATSLVSGAPAIIVAGSSMRSGSLTVGTLWFFDADGKLLKNTSIGGAFGKSASFNAIDIDSQGKIWGAGKVLAFDKSSGIICRFLPSGDAQSGLDLVGNPLGEIVNSACLTFSGLAGVSGRDTLHALTISIVGGKQVIFAVGEGSNGGNLDLVGLRLR